MSRNPLTRVLNNRPDVSAETVRKVQRVMEECHFVVNPNARGLKQAEQEIIAMIVRGRNNPFLNALAAEIALCKKPGKAALITEYIDEEADEFRHALGLLRRRRISGLIFVGSRIDERSAVLDSVSLPMVFATVSTVGTPMERASSVSMDDRKIACEAVTALLNRGHRKIAVFGGERSGQDSLALRAKGAEDAFRAIDLPFEDGRYVKTRLTLSDAYTAAVGFFRRCPDTTAAFCMGDTAALGVIRALADLGLNVPKDVSVMGVDGMEIGLYTTPRLSTVVQPVQEIAKQSAKVLADLMENGGPPRHVTVKAALEIRESVR